MKRDEAKRPRPWAVLAAERLPAYGLTPTQLAVARALLDHASPGRLEVWPSIGTLAARTGYTDRAVQKALAALEDRGAIVKTVASRGGVRAGLGLSNRWRLAFADGGVNPEPRSGLIDDEPRTARPEPRTPAQEPRTAFTPYPEPRSGEDSNSEGSSEVSQENSTTTTASPGGGAAAVVERDLFDRLGIQNYRGHPNATPERVDWIAREAPTKTSPTGWAAACIRDGYAVPDPPPPKADLASLRFTPTRRDLVHSWFREFPFEHRRVVLEAARRAYPNLRCSTAHPPDSPAMQSAIAEVIEGFMRDDPGWAEDFENWSREKAAG